MLLLCCRFCFLCYCYVRTETFSNFFNSLFLKQEYISKELFIKAMVRSKKRKIIEEVPQGVHLNTWLTAVQEASFVLGKIDTDKVSSPRARLRSILQAKLLALEIKDLRH